MRRDQSQSHWNVYVQNTWRTEEWVLKFWGGGNVAVVKGKTSPDLKNLGIFAAEIRDREVKLLPGSIIRSRMDHIPAWNVNTHTLSSEERRSCRFWKPACVFLPVWVNVHPIKIAGSLQSAVICTVVYCGILKMGGASLKLVPWDFSFLRLELLH